MRLELLYDESDLERLKSFVAEFGERPFVQRRRARNVVRTEPLDHGRPEIWRVHLGCLLTTQQRSGAGSAVGRLLDTRPFPIHLDLCVAEETPETFIQSQLQSWGGIRFSPKIARLAGANLAWLERTGWHEVETLLARLRDDPSRDEERAAARWLDLHLKGIGPKQSRNLLQWLGLAKYEIPLDSRVTRWANDYGFPLRLSGAALADQAYYEFVLDAIQELCAAVQILPCELDAMIFARDEPLTWAGDTNR